ncbi:acyl carrier protein [Parabacteroides sp.]|uniref:acyl carrier protein n=1 Tax=Parabacteroides sp. TaxID=1869337 RepID=UPI00257C7BF8|nr:acyl carrier protein [Parabacteroides sp.]
MDLKGFIENFASQFDDTDTNEIKADTKFRELEEWSSLTALSIIAMVDDEYEVQLKGNDMRAAVTVEDLYNVVKSKCDA